MTTATTWQWNRTGGQGAFAADDVSRFPGFVGGFRSGKTYSAARKAMRLCYINRCAGLVVAETYQQARQVMVPELLKAAAEAGLSAWWKPSEPCVVVDLLDERDTTHGKRRVVYVRSADKAERIAGFEVGWFWGDEVGRWPYLPEEPMRDPWTQCLARLSDDRAVIPQGIASGTHEGMGTRLYDDWVANPKAGHVLYRGSTRDNAEHLEEGYIPSLESSYDARLLDQYLDGEAVEMAAGLAYYAFGEENQGQTQYDPDLPLWWALDFNVAPLCTVICQPQGQPPGASLHVIRELVQPTSASTADVCQEFVSLYGNHPGEVRVYGDASGRAQDTRSKVDDWLLVQRILAPVFGDRFSLRVPQANPPVRARVARVNAICADGAGNSRLLLDPDLVPYLARDLRRVQWAANGLDLDKRARHKSLTHSSDALGYLVAVEYPPPTGSGGRPVVDGPRPAAARPVPHPGETRVWRQVDPMDSSAAGPSPW